MKGSVCVKAGQKPGERGGGRKDAKRTSTLELNFPTEGIFTNAGCVGGWVGGKEEEKWVILEMCKRGQTTSSLWGWTKRTYLQMGGGESSVFCQPSVGKTHALLEKTRPQQAQPQITFFF